MSKERHIRPYKLERQCERLLRIKNQPLGVKDLFDLSRHVVALNQMRRPKNKEELTTHLSKHLRVTNRRDGLAQFVDINFYRAQPSSKGRSRWETYGLRPDGEEFIVMYWPEKPRRVSQDDLLDAQATRVPGRKVKLTPDQLLAFAQTIWQAYEKTV